jgi:starch-binding outer membrane protein SusE/F
MKKYNIFIYLVVIGFFSLLSCEKDENRAILSDSPKAPELISPSDGTTKALTLADSANTITFTWNMADFGFKAAVNYTLQMDKTGDDFKSPIEIATASNDTANLNIYSFNNTLITHGIKFNEEQSLDVRIRATLTSADTLYSPIIKMKITPFFVGKIYPRRLWVVGDFQGWHNDNTAPFIAVIDSFKGNYEGYVNITSNNGFKFTSDHSWDSEHTFGDNGSNTGTSNQGILSQVNGGANITLLNGIGYLKINVDLATMTYTTLKTTWAIIGDATAGGWNADTPMTFNSGTKVWTITTNLTPGGLKFRANSGWDINYGDATPVDGHTLSAGGGNISIATAGSYTITLDLDKTPHVYTLVKN